jgi:hypothetical protein
MTIFREIPILAAFVLLAPVGCDGSTDPGDARDAADEPTRPATAHSDAARPRVELLEDGEPQPGRLIAVVEADLETTVYFNRGNEDADGRFAVDVTIVGRDGGVDYGDLLASGEHTPLELYLAVASADDPVPDDLRRAHTWQVESTRPAGPDGLTNADPVPLEITALSTFTCLSWSNFQANLATRFPGAPGREVFLDATTGNGDLWAPLFPNYYEHSHVDMIACNYNTGSSDSIRADLCDFDLSGDPLGTCSGTFLDDGWYIRQIFGPYVADFHRFRVTTDPVGAIPLQSFSGIVRRSP